MKIKYPRRKVAMLIWSYWPGHEGGAEKQCRQVVEALADEGVKFVILTSFYSPYATRIERTKSSTILRLGFLTPLENSFREGLLSFVHKTNQILNSGRFSRAIATHFTFWAMLPLVWASRLSFVLSLFLLFKKHGKSIDFIHVHESDWLAGVGAWLGGRYGVRVLAKTATAKALPTIGYDVPFRGFWNRKRRKCHFLALHNQHITELVLSGIPKDRVDRVPNGVFLPAVVCRPELKGPCLYVGNFSQGCHWKAFDVLIEAWALVHCVFPRAKLVLLGGGEVTPWLELAEQKGCEQSLQFQGWSADPSSFYLASSIFLLPSRIEGLSNALLEAQSYGLPCVVSDIPANIEVVQHEENGLVVPVGNAQLFAEAIIRLMNDSELRVRLGRAARKRIELSYSLAMTTNILKRIYYSQKDSR